MRILAWNIDAKTPQAGNWDYIINKLKPDIALLQECREQTDLGHYSGSHRLLLVPVGGSRSWGSAIYTKDLIIRSVNVSPSDAGWVIGAEVILHDGSRALVVSVHQKLAGVDYVVPPLIQLFEKIREFSQSYDHLIVGGDLNAARSYDTVYPQKNPAYRHNTLFDYLENQWCNCGLKQFGGEVQTIWGNSKHPYQNDYIFVDRELSIRPMSCAISARGEIAALSDHSYVMVDIA